MIYDISLAFIDYDTPRLHTFLKWLYNDNVCYDYDVLMIMYVMLLFGIQ